MAIATQHAVEHRKDLYPSRVHGEPEVLDRKDPVVYGSAEDGPLNQSELDRYERDGFLFFPGLFSEREMEFYRGELRRLNRRPDNSDRPEIVTEPGTNEVRSVFAIHEKQRGARTPSPRPARAGHCTTIAGFRGLLPPEPNQLQARF